MTGAAERLGGTLDGAPTYMVFDDADGDAKRNDEVVVMHDAEE